MVDPDGVMIVDAATVGATPFTLVGPTAPG